MTSEPKLNPDALPELLAAVVALRDFIKDEIAPDDETQSLVTQADEAINNAERKTS